MDEQTDGAEPAGRDRTTSTTTTPTTKRYWRGTLMRTLQLSLQRVLLTPVSAERTFEIDADVRDVDRMAQVIAAQWPMMSLAILGTSSRPATTS